jgi:hypothetical protein
MLTSYDMGDATEADFDRWVEYVMQGIDTACGFEVDVTQARWQSGPDRDRIRHATEEQEQTIREALICLWDAWCSEDAP